MNPVTPPINDIEFTGKLSGALGQTGGRHQFGLLLAMLEQDYLERLHIAKGEDEIPNPALDRTIQALPGYPLTPLKVEQHHWQQIQQMNKLLEQQSMADVRLSLVMHPHPLSQYNDATRIDEQVINNCSYHSQQKMQQPETAGKEVEIDETGLYDLLNQINAPDEQVA